MISVEENCEWCGKIYTKKHFRSTKCPECQFEFNDINSHFIAKKSYYVRKDNQEKIRELTEKFYQDVQKLEYERRSLKK